MKIKEAKITELLKTGMKIVPLRDEGPATSILTNEANALLIACSKEIINNGKTSRTEKKRITNSPRLRTAHYLIRRTKHKLAEATGLGKEVIDLKLKHWSRFELGKGIPATCRIALHNCKPPLIVKL